MKLLGCEEGGTKIVEEVWRLNNESFGRRERETSGLEGGRRKVEFREEGRRLGFGREVLQE